MSRPRVSIAFLMIVVVLLAIGIAALRYPTQLWAAALLSLTLGLLLTSCLGIAVCRGQRQASWTGFATFGGSYLVLCFAPWFDTAVGPGLLTTAILDMLYPKVALQPGLADLRQKIFSLPDIRKMRVNTEVHESPGDITVFRYPETLKGEDIKRVPDTLVPAPTRGTPAYGLGAGFGPAMPPVATPSPWQWWNEVATDDGGAVYGSIVLQSPDLFRRIGHYLMTLVFAFLGSRIAHAFYASRTRVPVETQT
jgi:hypothetical protein